MHSGNEGIRRAIDLLQLVVQFSDATVRVTAQGDQRVPAQSGKNIAMQSLEEYNYKKPAKHLERVRGAVLRIIEYHTTPPRCSVKVKDEKTGVVLRIASDTYTARQLSVEVRSNVRMYTLNGFVLRAARLYRRPRKA